MINEKNLKRKELRDKYVYYYEKNDISDNEHILMFLEGILKYLEEFEYEYDENFVFCGRKRFLYDEIIKIVNGEQKENDPVHFMLGSLNEFMRDDNFVSFGEEEAGIGFVELRNKNDLYSKKGIICKQEKIKIEEIINIIKRYINKCKEVNNVNSTEKYNEKYDIKPEDNRSQIVYGPPQFMLDENKKYNVDPEDNVPQKVYGVPNFDYLDEKIKKENIDIVIGNCCLSLTKCNNICDLLYVNKDIASYSNDLNIFISFQKFDEFCNRLKTIIADWNTGYLGDSGVKWKLNIDINGLSKQINGNGTYPENWNELIDLLSEYEILFKNNLN